MRTCLVDGCERPAKTRGWCMMHYMRWWTHGDPLKKLPLGPPARPILDRIDKSGGPEACWEWDGCHEGGGYASVWQPGAEPGTRGTMRKAHRLVYELLVGPIPAGLVLDHLCRNKGCVNPAHLEPVEQKTNVLRGVSPWAECARKTHCVNGHPFDEENTYLGPRKRGGMERVCRTCRRERNRRWEASQRAKKHR